MRYWMQIKAPAGNWVDSIGSNNIQPVRDHANWHHNKTGQKVRVVERTDIEVTK